MTEVDEELARILTKITFRGLTTSCVITDDEYKVINEARGEKIAEVAYKKGLNISTLLQNADDLIDEHNERLQMKVWREIRDLKLDLLSDVPRKKKSQAKQPPHSEEVESRLLLETIEEVSGLDPVELPPENIEKSVSPSSDELPDFEREMIARKILAPGGFDSISRLSPSLQRDNIENSAPPNITLNEIVPTPFNPNASIGDFGEASMNDIAVGGLFAGDEPFGRKLYNSLNSRGTPISPSLTRDANRSANPRNVQPRNLSLLPPEVQEVFVTDSSDLPAPGTPQASKIQDQDMDLDIPPLEQPRQDQPPIEMGPILDESAGQTPQAASGQVRESGGRSRREHFEQIVEEVEAAKQEAPKRRRKPRRQRRSPSHEREYTEILELNRPLGRRKSKKRVPHLRVPPIRLSIIMDIFAGLEDYQPDPIDEIEDDQQEQQLPQQDPVVRPPVLDFDLDLDLLPQPEQNVAQGTPQPKQAQESDNVTKRRRVDKTLEGISEKVQEISIVAEVPVVIAAMEPQIMDISAINFPSVDFASVGPPIADSTPSHRFAPPQTSTIVRDPRKIQQVTPDDIEYDRLRKASEAPLDPIPQEEGVDSIVSRMRRLRTERDKSALENIATLMPTPLLQPEPPTFITFQGKSEKMIAFIGHDGLRETYSEYCLETVGFYMQIRFIMAGQNSWKIKLADLKASGISLMQPASDHVIKMRLYLLADNGFLKLTESEDQIIDVEIPIEPKDDEMAA